MHLRDLEIHDGRVLGVQTPFDHHAAPITELYLATLGRSVKTTNIAKVQFHFYPVKRVPRWPDAVAYGIYERCVQFNFGRWRRLRGYDKKRFLLDTLHRELVRIATEQGWRVKEFERAMRSCLAQNILYQGFLLRGWVKHPRLALWANLKFTYVEDEFHADVVLRNRKKEIIESVPAIRKPAITDQVRHQVTDIKWIKGGQFVHLNLFVKAGHVGSPDINVSRVVARLEHPTMHT